MLALVGGLGVSVGYEQIKAPGCFQEQISSYYYTPAHNVVVGVLLALGVCLLCVRGNTPGEDILLNFAGMFAAISAVVPTPLVKATEKCSSAPHQAEDLQSYADNTRAYISNGAFAVLAVGLIVLLILGWHRRKQLDEQENLWRQPAVYAYIGAWLVWLTTVLVLWLAPGAFQNAAHPVAATLMLFFIFMVVVHNACAIHKRTAVAGFPRRNYYALIAVLIVLFIAAFAITAIAGWKYAPFGAEVSFLALFAVFWIIQTKELWRDGLRPVT